MLATYPSAWLMLTLPFLSSCVIRHVPELLYLAGRWNRTMRLVGVAGLTGLLVSLTGLVPPAYGIPIMAIGGILSGFTVFTLPRPDDGGDDWRRWRPPPDDPPPSPDGDEQPDWQLFDRLRAQWERQPVAH